MKNYILFDCDGTLVDSEVLAMPVATRTLISIAKKQGCNVPDLFVSQLFGKPISEMVRRLEDVYDVRYDFDIAQEIHAETIRVLAANTQATEGIGAFLDHCLNQDLSLAVVTSSALDRVIPALERANLRTYFRDEFIFSAESTLSTPQPKPSPAIYLYAMEKLGIMNAGETLTFEDSATGVQSAVKAGIPVIGYLGGSHLDGIRQTHGDKLNSDGATALITAWNQAIAYLPKREFNQIRSVALTAKPV